MRDFRQHDYNLPHNTGSSDRYYFLLISTIIQKWEVYVNVDNAPEREIPITG